MKYIITAAICYAAIWVWVFYAINADYQAQLKLAKDTCYTGSLEICDKALLRLTPSDRNFVTRSYKNARPDSR